MSYEACRKNTRCSGEQAQCKREFIPSGGANNRESLTLFKRRAGPENQEHEPKNEVLSGRLNPKPVYRDQSSKMGHNQRYNLEYCPELSLSLSDMLYTNLKLCLLAVLKFEAPLSR